MMSKKVESFTAKDIMTENVIAAYEGWSIKKLSDFFIKHGISGAPVIAGDHSLVGVVTATDIINFESKTSQEKTVMIETIYQENVGYNYQQSDIKTLALHAEQNCTVHQIMAKHVIQIDENALLDELAEVMLEQGIRRIFITRKDIMVGVITTTNILQAIVDNGKLSKINVA